MQTEIEKVPQRSTNAIVGHAIYRNIYHFIAEYEARYRNMKCRCGSI